MINNDQQIKLIKTQVKPFSRLAELNELQANIRRLKKQLNPSVLAKTTDSLSFESVGRLVTQVEGLTNIQRNIRQHQSINN